MNKDNTKINTLQLLCSFEVGGIEKLLLDFVKTSETKNFQAIPGKGISGEVEGQIYYLGTRKLLEET